ncbi:sporulation protein [Longispora albida]|uniref:sporulation protein n=1 Tax=Longispora albida TaxID=203523 RepID=UPI00037EC995|nr:sporulation protein [Longispora albida]
MVFKKMMRAFGVGGPSVDTVLTNPNTRPGLNLEGHVNITGGDHVVDIEYVSLGLVTKVEVESGDSEYNQVTEFHRLNVAGRFQVMPKQPISIPFQFPMPWETPITNVTGGQRLHGMTMGLRTELAVAGAIDKGDLDQVNVHPLPAQERIIEAFGRLGFRFKAADVERGHIRGSRQTLPFYQEVEFYAPPQYPGVNGVEVTFLANPQYMDVILEFDKRGGLFTSGHDTITYNTVDYRTVDSTDWAAQVDAWCRAALGRRQSYAPQQGHYPPPQQPHYGHQQHGYRHRRGHGMAGGVVGGLAAGYVAGEVLDDLFDGD